MFGPLKPLSQLSSVLSWGPESRDHANQFTPLDVDHAHTFADGHRQMFGISESFSRSVRWFEKDYCIVNWCQLMSFQNWVIQDLADVLYPQPLEQIYDLSALISRCHEHQIYCVQDVLENICFVHVWSKLETQWNTWTKNIRKKRKTFEHVLRLFVFHSWRFGPSLTQRVPGEPFAASELVTKGPAVVYAIRRPGWGAATFFWQRFKALFTWKKQYTYIYIYRVHSSHSKTYACMVPNFGNVNIHCS